MVGKPLLLPKIEEMLQLGNFLGAPVLQHVVEQVRQQCLLQLMS